MRDHGTRTAMLSEIVMHVVQVRLAKKQPLNVGDDYEVPIVPVRRVINMREHPDAQNQNERGGNVDRDDMLLNKSKYGESPSNTPTDCHTTTMWRLMSFII
jgi:hypothetical protein